MVRHFPRWNCSSWNCFALSRRMEEASQLSMTPEQAPMAHLRSKGLAFQWNAIATSAHHTQAPVWIRSTGRTRVLSIHKGILASLQALRLLKTNAGRSASRNAHLRSQISRSRMDAEQTSRIAVLGLFSVLSMGRELRFVTMPASLRSALDTDGVQVSS